MNIETFLIFILFYLYIMVVLLRVWLQAARADFCNPFSQFIVKVTQPVVAPLRCFIPSVGSMDLGIVLFAYVLCVLNFASIDIIDFDLSFAALFDVDYLIFVAILGAISLLKAAGELLFWVLLIRAILSWVSQGQGPIGYVFHQLTEPMLSSIRRILPPMGGFDLSVLVLLIVLLFANSLMRELIRPISYLVSVIIN